MGKGRNYCKRELNSIMCKQSKPQLSRRSVRWFPHQFEDLSSSCLTDDACNVISTEHRDAKCSRLPVWGGLDAVCKLSANDGLSGPPKNCVDKAQYEGERWLCSFKAFPRGKFQTILPDCKEHGEKWFLTAKTCPNYGPKPRDSRPQPHPMCQTHLFMGKIAQNAVLLTRLNGQHDLFWLELNLKHELPLPHNTEQKRP